MKRTGNINMLNEALTENLKDKIFFFLCNSNLGQKDQQKLMKMMNQVFLEGKGETIETIEDSETDFEDFPGLINFED